MTKRPFQYRSRGFTLIELAIVLGVVGVLAAGLFRLMSTGNSQSKDASTAQQQQALIAAVAGYLSDNSSGGGQNVMKAMGAYGTQNIPLPTSNTSLSNCQATGYALSGGLASPYANMCNFLPPGFTQSTTNSYGQTYTIQVLKDNTPPGPTAPQTYSYEIATTGPVVPDVDGGRISSLIGGDGGFVYTSPVCTGAASSVTACGTMGAWSNVITNPGTSQGYGFASSQFGSIVSRSFISPGTNSSYFWLARSLMPSGAPDLTYNTMATDLYMSGATNINMSSGALIFSGTDVSGSIQMGTGFINLASGYISGPGLAGGAAQIELGSGAYTAGTLISLTTGCTAISTAGCPAALYVTTGDVFVAGEVTATKVYSASDERLKMNIHPIVNPLDNIMKIDPVSFNFKNGGSASMGIVAQQLETVYPELVHETNGTKYVEYTALIGPLIGAIQELKHQNDDLRAKLHEQEMREQDLERTLKGTSATP